jgi:hypothetical protein
METHASHSRASVISVTRALDFEIDIRNQLLGAQPLCSRFSTTEKVVLALQLFYKFVKCWTRAKSAWFFT